MEILLASDHKEQTFSSCSLFTLSDWFLISQALPWLCAVVACWKSGIKKIEHKDKII
jgi:hypothetical protein